MEISRGSTNNNTVDNGFCPLGVRLCVLDGVIARIRQQDNLDDQALGKLTTEVVCKKYVKEWTKHERISYRELLVRRATRRLSKEKGGVTIGEDKRSAADEMEATSCDCEMRDEEATVFISHAWTYSFVEVVETLKQHFSATTTKQEAGPTATSGGGRRGGGNRSSCVVVWFDVFTHNQYTTVGFEGWCSAFFEAIKRFGRMVMVLSPWDDPVPLTRAWCLFELYATIHADAKFEVALSTNERCRFGQQFARRYGAFEDMLGRVDMRRSEATNKEDKERIIELVEKRVGIVEANQMVFREMRRWVIEAAYSNVCDTRDELGDNHPGTLESIRTLGLAYHVQSDYKRAWRLYVITWEKQRIVLGDNHPSTLASINNLAALYESQGNYDAAELLFVTCLEKTREVLGDSHPSTLTSINNLATLNKSQGNYDAAELLYMTCLEKRREVLGDSHPFTLASINNLAGLYNSQGNYDAAEPLYMTCLEKKREVLGDNHPSTLTSINNLAVLYERQGGYDAAELLFVTCLERTREVLGDNHPSTLVSINNLAALYESQGNYDAAESLYMTCLETRIEVLGDNHPSTLASINNLATLYFHRGSYQSAATLLADVVQRSKINWGDKHPRTISAARSLDVCLSFLSHAK